MIDCQYITTSGSLDASVQNFSLTSRNDDAPGRRRETRAHTARRSADGDPSFMASLPKGFSRLAVVRSADNELVPAFPAIAQARLIMRSLGVESSRGRRATGLGR